MGTANRCRRRRVRLLGLLCLILLPGCLIPYAFPTVSCVPAVPLGAEAVSVHAFRVDVTRKWIDIGAQDAYRLAEIPVSALGSVPVQGKLSATYGMYVLGVALNYPVYTSHSVEIRLYRPGFKLVEVESWDLLDRVEWKKLAPTEDEEQVLDRLYLTSDSAKCEDHWPACRRFLEPGSASAAHRAALLFGVAEYERLAADPNAAVARPRLLDKAQALRTLAEK